MGKKIPRRQGGKNIISLPEMVWRSSLKALVSFPPKLSQLCFLPQSRSCSRRRGIRWNGISVLCTPTRARLVLKSGDHLFGWLMQNKPPSCQTSLSGTSQNTIAAGSSGLLAFWESWGNCLGQGTERSRSGRVTDTGVSWNQNFQVWYWTRSEILGRTYIAWLPALPWVR